MGMSVIQSHNTTLRGGTRHRIVLKPLTDEHLPLLYKWNADPDVLYWTEGGEDIVRSYDKDVVHKIFGGVSQNAFCFLIEVDGVPVGECWLQKMNLNNVLTMYDSAVEVRRIDMAIGEKGYWNKGIGSEFIPMVIDFAFNSQHIDVLHCFCEDYNPRSRRMWEKSGFTLILTEALPQPQKGKYQYHFRLTREEYMNKKQ
jgi:aminoglycoside 6'-N-acetyltransferase